MPDAPLISSVDAARALGISARTIQRYAKVGLITPDITLASGQYRWNLDRLRDQINAINRTE